MELRELAGLGGVPVVIALVAVVNTALVLDKRWSPLLAIALGVACRLVSRSRWDNRPTASRCCGAC